MKTNLSAFDAAYLRAVQTALELQTQLKRIEPLRETDMDAAYSAALKAESISETLTLQLRSLPAYTGHPKAQQEVNTIIHQQIPIRMGFTEQGWFVLVLPMLLPKKGEGSASYIRSALYPAMKEYFRTASPVRYRDTVLIYRHVYDRNRPEREYRDHDNIELNMVTDIVTLYVLEDDAPARCCHYYCTASDMEESTEVYVVPRQNFEDWLKYERALSAEGKEPRLK